jgi:hypothetical protein
LKWSLERRSGTADDDTAFRTQYLDGGRSWMNHRHDTDGYEEIIHCTQLSDTSCHIIRTVREPGGGWAVHLSSVIRDEEDGSQREQRFDGLWSYEEAINYSRLMRGKEPG